MIDEESTVNSKVDVQEKTPQDEINEILKQLGRQAAYKINSPKVAAEIAVIAEVEKMNAIEKINNHEKRHILNTGAAPLNRELTPDDIKMEIKRFKLAKQILRKLDIHYPSK